MKPAPLFIERCAGLASVSGVLQHGSGWKPPISRMGRKTRLAVPILRVMGLRPRQGAARYVWCEADGDVAALLAAYTQPDVMRKIAETIRSWIPCPYGPHDGWCVRCKGTGRWDARDLWETLRREERQGFWDGGGSVGDVAGSAYLWQNAYRRGQPESGFDDTDARPDPADRRGTGRPAALACAFDATAHPWPPVVIARDAAVSPVDVAGWAAHTAWTRGDGALCVAPGACPPGVNPAVSAEGLIERFATAHPWPPVALTPAADLPPPDRYPDGTVVYMDPPYVGTTGYRHTFDRAAVIDIALADAAAGARVYISEGEPIPIPGWHHVDLTGEQKGQARTFGATAEWLTCSHPPAWRPVRQASLF